MLLWIQKLPLNGFFSLLKDILLCRFWLRDKYVWDSRSSLLAGAGKTLTRKKKNTEEDFLGDKQSNIHKKHIHKKQTKNNQTYTKNRQNGFFWVSHTLVKKKPLSSTLFLASQDAQEVMLVSH